MSEEVFDKLKVFTLKEAYLADESINRNSRLYQDLKLTGDDAIEFIIAYGIYFKVDLTNFMAADYFEGEGMNLLIGNGCGKKVLTLGDLEKGIIAGKLDDEVITPQ